jgi:heme/copper-type cytochrome/quinol oxidase subunit 3
MTYTSFLLIIFLSSAAAAGLSYAVHRLVHVDTRRRHQEVGVSVFLQLGVLFAVLLAFVFSEAYGEYGEAQQAIDLECGALHATAMLASTLPAPQARALLGLEASYIKDIIRYDWPDMQRDHRGSPIAVADLTALLQDTARLPAPGAADVPVKAQILDLLSTAHAQREVRLYQAQNGLPVVLWAVLIMFSILLMVFVTFSGIEDYIWLTSLVVTFAACVSAILTLVGLLNYPFQGAIGLTPEDFEHTLSMVMSLLNALGPP